MNPYQDYREKQAKHQVMTYDLLNKYGELAKREKHHKARKFERDLMLEFGQMSPEDHARHEARMAADLAEARTAIVEHEKSYEKQAGTVFLGGKVSGPDGKWREEVKQDLRDAGHKPIDPKKPKWDPTKDIYKEVEQMLTADKVVFYKGGEFTKREKKLLDAVGKDYDVIKKPEDALKAAAFAFPVKKDALGVLRRLDNTFGRNVSDSVVTRAYEMAQSRGELKATLRDVLQARHLYSGEHLRKRASDDREETHSQRFGHRLAHTAAVAGATHVGLNAGIMAKDKYAPQLMQKSMDAGLTHALHGRGLRPSVHEGLGLLAGFETVGTEYDMAHKLGDRVLNSRYAKGDPERAAKLLKRIGNTKLLDYAGERNHAFGNLRDSLKNLDVEKVKAYKPNNLLTIEKAKVDPHKAYLARKAVNAGAVAAGVFINPDLAIGPIVNKGRQMLGNTELGKQMAKDMLSKGVTNGRSTAGKKLVTSLLASPAVGELQNMGAIVGDAVRGKMSPRMAESVNSNLAGVIKGQATKGQAAGSVAKDLVRPAIDKVKTVGQPVVDRIKNVAQVLRKVAAEEEVFNPYRAWLASR